MPKWSTQPPYSPHQSTLPIERTPPKGYLTGWITSSKIVGCPVHWYKGRTKPCELDNCPACENNIPWRWKGYLGLYIKQNSLHVLLEFPAAVGDRFGEFLANERTLRHALVSLNRVPEKPNGKIHLRIKRDREKIIAIPDEPNIVQILSTLWDLPITEGVEVPDRYSSTQARINKDTMPDNGHLQ